MIAVDTLMEESKCYLCLGISQAEALELALLNRIAAGGGGAGGYEMVLGILQGLTFADGTAYYFGELSASATTAFYTTAPSLQVAKVLTGGTISHWYLSIRRSAGAVPSNEMATFSLVRQRGVMFTTLATIQTDWVAAITEVDTTSLIQSDLQAGDYLYVELTTPAWITNPGSTLINCRLAIA